jgi:hypothetical protein
MLTTNHECAQFCLRSPTCLHDLAVKHRGNLKFTKLDYTFPFFYSSHVNSTHFDVSRVLTAKRNDWALHLHIKKRYMTIHYSRYFYKSFGIDFSTQLIGAWYCSQYICIYNLFNVIPHVLKNTTEYTVSYMLDQQY